MVTADYRARAATKGIDMQDRGLRRVVAIWTPGASDGIFVFLGNTLAPTAWSIGDRV